MCAHVLTTTIHNSQNSPSLVKKIQGHCLVFLCSTQYLKIRLPPDLDLCPGESDTLAFATLHDLSTSDFTQRDVNIREAVMSFLLLDAPHDLSTRNSTQHDVYIRMSNHPIIFLQSIKLSVELSCVRMIVSNSCFQIISLQSTRLSADDSNFFCIARTQV